MTLTLSPEQYGAILAFLGGVGVVLKKCGWVTFGKPTERRKCPGEVQKICGDHLVMKQDIETIRENSKARLEKLNQMDLKLDILSEEFAELKGYIKGKNGYSS